jgi:hypothetical protein
VSGVAQFSGSYLFVREVNHVRLISFVPLGQRYGVAKRMTRRKFRLCRAHGERGRRLAVHLFVPSVEHDFDLGVVSFETEYFAADGISENARDEVRVSGHTSRYTQTHR